MMNYLGYLRKRNPAGTPRRTLSHFLVCDSEKKVSLQTHFRTCFLRLPAAFLLWPAGTERIVPPLRGSFFFLLAVRFSPCSRMGFSGLCRASGARSRDARNAETNPSARGNNTRESKIIRRGNPAPRRVKLPHPPRHLLDAPASPEPRRGGTISARERCKRAENSPEPPPRAGTK